jgi:ABC-2 type transport system permease protein
VRSYTLANIFAKSLRDNRAGIVAWGTGVGLLMVATASQYATIIGPAGPARERLAAETAKAFQAFSFLLGDITSLDTMGGFVTTRVIGEMPVIFGLWAAVVAAGLIRGEEQDGALDVLLSTPHSRRSALGQKAAALLVALLIALVLTILGLELGAITGGEPLPLDGLFLTMLNVLAVSAFWGVLGLLICQFTITRRTASSITGALIFGTYLLNNTLGSISGLEWTAWIMPFHYYAVSKPLVPGRAMEWGAWLALVAATVLLLALTSLIFERRDIGSAFKLFTGSGVQKAKASAGSTWLLGSVLGKNIRDLIGPTLAWSAGLALYAIVIISTTNQALGPLRDILSNAGWIASIVGNLATPQAYLSVAMFIYFPVLVVVFSITQVIGWTDDEEVGRLELLVSEPIPRVQLLLVRYLAIVLAMAVIVVLTGVAILLTAAVAGVDLDAGSVTLSLVTIIPPAFTVAAFGLCLAAWFKRPSAAVPFTIAVVAVMFFLDFLAPILHLPEVVLNLSVFHLYGKPLTDGVNGGGAAALVVASIVLLAGSLAGLNRRDIAK